MKKDTSGFLNIYNYIYYCYLYLLFFFHYQKVKLVVIIGKSVYNKDYILWYVIGGWIFLYYAQQFVIKKFNSLYLLIFCYFFLLLFYGQQNLVLLHTYIYFLENIFFYFFGFMGIIFPFLFLNQIIFILLLLLFVVLNALLIYFNIFNNFLGVWSGVSFLRWCILVLLLIIFIFSEAFLLLLQESPLEKKDISSINDKSTHENISVDNKTVENFITTPLSSPLGESAEGKGLLFFTPQEMQEIYKTAPTKNIEEIDLREQILEILKNFHIYGIINEVLKSRTVINYFFKPKVGTKTSRIESIEEELSMELNRSVRITTNMKGIIIEVSNLQVQSFSFKDIWTSEKNNSLLPLFLGFDTFGEKVVLDLTKQPHILMCGTTGSGKSSTLHSMIHSLITTKLPTELKFVFIDPKILELSIYKNIPHLWRSIVTNLDEAQTVLESLVVEMEDRYKLISKSNKRSIVEFNKTHPLPLPYIVFCIEEFADLALYKNNNFKTLVQRLAQMGRAAGIHGIICTQRPSANVVDGVIKANFPTRVALKVANKLESRIILDTGGAERLSNPGEMIILDGTGMIRRAMAPYITEEEIIRLIKKLSEK